MRNKIVTNSKGEDIAIMDDEGKLAMRRLHEPADPVPNDIRNLVDGFYMGLSDTEYLLFEKYYAAINWDVPEIVLDTQCDPSEDDDIDSIVDKWYPKHDAFGKPLDTDKRYFAVAYSEAFGYCTYHYDYSRQTHCFELYFADEPQTAIAPDMINHPSHYTTGGIECIDAMIASQGVEAVTAYCTCNAFKYIWRHKHKNGSEDLRKARWYITKALALMEEE